MTEGTFSTLPKHDDELRYAPIKATDYNSGVDEYISDEEKKVKKPLSLEPS
jgi:hypothetical protein